MSGKITCRKVAETLGENKIISATTVIEGWNKALDEQRTDFKFKHIEIPRGVEVRYHIKTLEKFLKNPTWFLIYDLGFSLRKVVILLGSDSVTPPCHYRGNDWWDSNKYPWVNDGGEPNYYLLQVPGACRGKKWKEQESEITSNGKEFQRVSTRLMINLSITWFLSKGVYLQKTCYHWGSESDANGTRCASRFDEKGFALFNRREQHSDENLGTFVIRKFDF